MSEGSTVGTVAQFGGLVLAAGLWAVIMFVMVQAFVSRRARGDRSRGEEYRAALQAATAAQERTEQRLTELTARLAAVEKLLRDVE